MLKTCTVSPLATIYKLLLLCLITCSPEVGKVEQGTTVGTNEQSQVPGCWICIAKVSVHALLPHNAPITRADDGL